MSRPAISVIMAVYNGGRFLRDSITSILQQTFDDFEFIIVDDGSVDGTPDVLAGVDDPRVFAFRNRENLGVSKSLNRALRHARGDFIARQDADDYSRPQRFSAQLEFFKSHASIGVLGTAYTTIDPAGKPLQTYWQPTNDTRIRWQMLFHSAFCHPSVMLRRELVEDESKAYDECLTVAQDYDFWARCLRKSKGANIESSQLFLRQHGGQISRARRREQQSIAAQISRRQIKQLLGGERVDKRSVSELRRWFYSFPRRLKGKDLKPVILLMELMREFPKDPRIDQQEFRRIEGYWRSKVLLAAEPILRKELIRMGLVKRSDVTWAPFLHVWGAYLKLYEWFRRRYRTR